MCYLSVINYLQVIVYRLSWIEIDGTVYKPGSVVVLTSSLMPQFGIITDILMLNIDDYYFSCELLCTVSFNEHFHAYEVTRSSLVNLVICKQSELIDYHVLGMYAVAAKHSVSLKYHLMENF